jgi:nitrite reductase (NADH) small subunit
MSRPVPQRGEDGVCSGGGCWRDEAEGKAIAVANVGGQFHAIDNTCLHRGGPLGDGALEGNVVTCPWHGWQFDTSTGKMMQSPAMGVACYAVEVRGGEVFVDLG